MNLIQLFQQARKAPLSVDEKAWLAEQLARYPYFSLLHFIRARNAVASNEPRAENIRAEAAIYALDRKRFAEYLDDSLVVNLAPAPPREAPAPAPAPVVSAEIPGLEHRLELAVARHAYLTRSLADEIAAHALQLEVQATRVPDEPVLVAAPLTNLDEVKQTVLSPDFEILTPDDLVVDETPVAEVTAPETAPASGLSLAEQIELEIRNRRRPSLEELEALDARLIVHDEGTSALSNRSEKQREPKAEPAEPKPYNSMSRFVLPRFDTKPATLHEPPRSPEPPEAPAAKPGTDTPAEVGPLDLPLTTPSMKRFVEPEFTPKPATLDSPSPTDPVAFEQARAQGGLPDEQPLSPEERLRAELEAGLLRSADMGRFDQPEFMPKPATLDSPSPTDPAAFEQARAQGGLPDEQPLSPEEQFDAELQAGLMRTPTMGRFITPEFDPKPETLNAPAWNPITETHANEAALQDLTALEARLRSEAFERFVEPEFDPKPETLNAPPSDDPATETPPVVLPLRTPSFDRFITFELGSPHTTSAQIEPFESTPKAPAPPAAPLEVPAEPEPAQPAETTLAQRLHNESLTRFVEPDFGLERLHKPAEPAATEVPAAQTTEETLRALSERVQRIQTESMSRFVEPEFEHRRNQATTEGAFDNTTPDSGKNFDAFKTKNERPPIQRDSTDRLSRLSDLQRRLSADSMQRFMAPTLKTESGEPADNISILASFQKFRFTEAAKTKDKEPDATLPRPEPPAGKIRVAKPRTEDTPAPDPAAFQVEQTTTEQGLERLRTRSMKRFVEPEFDQRPAGGRKLADLINQAPVSVELPQPDAGAVNAAPEPPAEAPPAAVPGVPSTTTEPPALTVVSAATGAAMEERRGRLSGEFAVEIVLRPDHLKLLRQTPPATLQKKGDRLEPVSLDELLNFGPATPPAATEAAPAPPAEAPWFIPDALLDAPRTPLSVPPPAPHRPAHYPPPGWGWPVAPAPTVPAAPVVPAEEAPVPARVTVAPAPVAPESSPTPPSEPPVTVPAAETLRQTPPHAPATQPPTLIEEAPASGTPQIVEDMISSMDQFLARIRSSVPPGLATTPAAEVPRTTPPPAHKPEATPPAADRLEPSLVDTILNETPEDRLYKPHKPAERDPFRGLDPAPDTPATEPPTDRLSSFRDNLSKIRNRALQDPTEITMRNIQRKFLDSVVLPAARLENEPPADPSSNPELTSPSSQDTPPDPIDRLIDQFREFEPRIFAHIQDRTQTLANMQMLDFQLEDTETPTEDIDRQWATETMAGIYAQQGQLAKARRVYEILMEQKPDREAYFRQKITELGFAA